jgi:hypothetical protein
MTDVLIPLDGWGRGGWNTGSWGQGSTGFEVSSQVGDGVVSAGATVITVGSDTLGVSGVPDILASAVISLTNVGSISTVNSVSVAANCTVIPTGIHSYTGQGDEVVQPKLLYYRWVLL